MWGHVTPVNLPTESNQNRSVLRDAFVPLSAREHLSDQ